MDVLNEKLGELGAKRIEGFRRLSGVERHDAHADAMLRFLEKAAFPAGCTPSVFLTDRGGIELCWEDVTGKAVQVEFTSEFAEYYRAAKADEGALPLRDLTALIERVFA